MPRGRKKAALVHSNQCIRSWEIRTGAGGIVTAFLDFRSFNQARIAPVKAIQKFDRRDDLGAMNGWPEFTKEFVTDLILAEDMLVEVLVGPQSITVRSITNKDYFMGRINQGLATSPYRLANDDSDERIG